VCDLRKAEAINNNFYSDLVVVGDDHICPQEMSESDIEIDMRSSNWELSTRKNGLVLKMNLHNESQFMSGASAANQSAARHFLVSVMLTMFKKKLSEIRLQDISDEILNWSRVGVSENTGGWLKLAPGIFYDVKIFGHSKWELVTDINKSLERLNLAIRLPEKNTNDSTALMWKIPPSTHHKHWIDINPQKIRVLVRQDRTILAS
jgi:hypothetical protein